ncbi:hypothetical protein [Levilactobacillus mulengensis]|uniref:hypothetical protein n=1 Tax=Levilactobacillus mulengensis TaxID=2486025 RepID=UPI000F78C269|nr:hypothetical protein [Levilactobacillus mulengensis]
MKKILFTLTVLLAIVGGVTFVTTSTVTAQAAKKHYTVVPKSLRGHWRQYNAKKHGYDKVIFTKWQWKTKNAGQRKWYTLSGKKFKVARRVGGSPWYSDLAISKAKWGYNVGQSYSDEWPYWKKVRHNGKTALRCYMPPLGPGKGRASYYYHK